MLHLLDPSDIYCANFTFNITTKPSCVFVHHNSPLIALIFLLITHCSLCIISYCAHSSPNDHTSTNQKLFRFHCAWRPLSPAMADGLPDIAMDDSAQGVPTSADDAHHNVAPGATSQQTPAGLDTQLMDTITKEVSQAPVTTPVTAPAKPTTAGFLLEESEEEDATDPHLNGDTQANGSGDTIPTQAQDVQISSAATQDPPPLVQSTVQTASDTAAAPTYLSDSAVAPATSVDSLPPSLPNTNAVAAPEIAATPVQNGIASIPPTANVFKRLPHDKVGQLEDRISDEPRADPEAWFSLIAHYKEKDQLDNVRQTYDRFLEVYPTAVSQVCSYC